MNLDISARARSSAVSAVLALAVVGSPGAPATGATAPHARPSSASVAVLTAGLRIEPLRERLPTTMSIFVTGRRVDPSGTAVLHGQLRSHRTGIPHRRVDLLAKTEGTWSVAAHLFSGRGGRLRFEVSPQTSTAYRFVFAGTRVFRPSRSGVVRVGVRPTVSITVSASWLDPGDSATISGVVTYEGEPLTGAEVRLRARTAHSSHRFRTVGSATTGSDGSVTLSDAPVRDTVYRLVSMRAGGVPKGVSPAVKVHVRYGTSLSIRGRQSHDGCVVSGVLRGHGSTIPGAPVILASLAPGSTVWTDEAIQDTSRHGRVRFVVPISEGTSYRLSYGGAKRFASTISGVVVD
jgi:hypothetical protein